MFANKAKAAANEAETAAKNALTAAKAVNLTAEDPSLTGNAATRAANLTTEVKKITDEAKALEKEAKEFADNAQNAANMSVPNPNDIETNIDGNPGTSENVSTITTTKSPTKEMKVMIGGPGLGSKQTNSGYALSSTFVGIVIILILNLIIN